MPYACVDTITYGANLSATFVCSSLIPFVIVTRLTIFINGFMSVTYVYIFLFIFHMLPRIRVSETRTKKNRSSSTRKIFLLHFPNNRKIYTEKTARTHKKYKIRWVFLASEESHAHIFQVSGVNASVCITLSKPNRVACLANTFTDLITVWRVLYQFKRITYFSSSFTSCGSNYGDDCCLLSFFSLLFLTIPRPWLWLWKHNFLWVC